MIRARAVAVAVLAGGPALGGCEVGRLIGGMAQNYEYLKLVEVHPAYEGLENTTLAVLVDVDMVTAYEHPEVAMTIATNVSHEIQTNVPGARVLAPQLVSDWQFRTPQWAALPYADITKDLGVDHLVYIDLYEFRLHPPGNRWLWEGLCAANVGIIERDGLDPNSFTESFHVTSEFPDLKGVSRESASARAIQAGLLKLFIQNTSWLFYTHLEPKYPDKYDGPPPEEVWEQEQAKRARKQQKKS